MGCQASVHNAHQLVLKAPAGQDFLRIPSAPESTGPLCTFRVALHGKQGDVLGAALGDCEWNSDCAVIAHVTDRGLLHQWNCRNPGLAVESGDLIVEANNATGYWNILSQIQKMGALDIVVRKGASKAECAFSLQQQKVAEHLEGAGSVLFRMPSPRGCHGARQGAASIVTIPILRSKQQLSGAPGSEPSEQCAICLDALDADQNVVRLPCHHEFHVECVYKWFRHHSQDSCPLCERPVVDVVSDADA